AVIEEHLQPLSRSDPEMMAAGRTHVKVLLQVFAINRRGTLFVLAFDEYPFGFDCAFFGGGRWTNFVGFAFDPSHRLAIVRSGPSSVKDTRPALIDPRCRPRGDGGRACRRDRACARRPPP